MATILVYGGRAYRARGLVFAALDHIHDRIGIDKIVHGDASGADYEAGLWALRSNVEQHRCPAKWRDLSHPDAVIRHGRSGAYDARAGLRRNGEMLAKYPPDFAVEFPGGPGTANMRARLDAAGIRVIQIYPHDFNSHVLSRP